MNRPLPPDVADHIVGLARSGQSQEVLLAPLLEQGWAEDDAIDAVDHALREFLDRHAEDSGLPPSVPVPSPIGLNGPSVVRAADRDVRIVMSLMLPRVVVLGGLLGEDECDELVEMSRRQLKRSLILNPDTGADEVHAHRTSEGTHFERGATPLVARIEARIAALLEWPLENGERIQVLRYGAGAEYRPHHDYFDPQWPGCEGHLKRGGQRVASVVMYLNTPAQGGATVFPESKLEIGAVKGNAVFFSYDRPHPMTRTLHAGAPVLEGDKWIATKWLRERRHD